MASREARNEVVEGTLWGPDPAALFRAAASLVLGGRTPDRLQVDLEERAPTGDWLETWLPRVTRKLLVEDRGYAVLIHRPDLGLSVDLPAPRRAGVLAEVLAPLPFTLGSFPHYPQAWLDRMVKPVRFDERNADLGWAVAFRGAGHDRLVSRRWLAQDLFTTARAGEVTVVQLFELGADADAALEDARPAQVALSAFHPESGVLLEQHPYTADVGGLLDAAARRLTITVHGRDVSRAEMKDACAARRDRNLASVAYVFAEEAVARRHLRDLWLRELECWFLADSGDLVRLDGHDAP